MSIFLFAFALFLPLIAGDTLSNSNCIPARVLITVPSDEGQCGFGKANSTTGVGSKYVASIDQINFQNGVECGSCWELAGPAGSVVVIVTNMCSSQSPLCVGDVTQFAIGPEAFDLISSDPNPNAQLLYDVSARQVACDVEGPLKIKVEGSNVYAVQAFAYNMDEAVSSLYLSAANWGPLAMTRNPFTSGFQFSSSTQQAIPPLTFTAYSVSGQSLSLTIQGSIIYEDILSFSSNFDTQSLSGDSCTVFPPQGDIFHDKEMGYGWQTQNSQNYQGNFTSEADPFQGPTSLFLEMGSEGFFLASRNGGFLPGDYTHITFAVRSVAPSTPLTVFLSTNNDTFSLPFVATSAWVVQEIPLDSIYPSITSSSLIWGIGWENNATEQVALYMDNIALINVNDPSSWPDWNSTNVLPPPPVVPLVTTSTSGRQLPPSTTTTTATSPASQVIYSIPLLLSIALVMIAL